MRLQGKISTRRIFRRLAPLAVCALLAAAAPRGFGQTPADQAPAPAGEPQPSGAREKGPKRILLGLRVRGTPLRQFSIMSNRTQQTTTTSPVAEYNHVTTSRSFPAAPGVLVEVRLGTHLLWRAEAMRQRLKYDKVTQLFEGAARTLTGITERTSATTWEIPVMLQFRPAAQSGLLKNIYIAGGASMRTIRDLKSVTTTDHPDDSITSHRIPALMQKKNLRGTVVAVGWRFIDDFGINFTPEIRYTRWSGYTFRTDSTISPRNQLEAGFAFTF